ncbi:hypothetical protein Q8A73_013910 [Channa argus]|nr:hypothetical protein Q8A73_013910 [Channa argus]
MSSSSFLDLIGLEFGEILSPASTIHDEEGNWSSSGFGDVGHHGTPHRKFVSHRVISSARGSVKILRKWFGYNECSRGGNNCLDLSAADGDGFVRLKILQDITLDIGHGHSRMRCRRSVLVVLFVAISCGKRRCNYREILGSYREVIFVELQNLNLTGSFDTSKDRDPCPSVKAHRILSSIYSMTQQMRCQRSGKQLAYLEKPLESMEQLIIHNCKPNYLGKKASCSALQKVRGKKRKRTRLIKVIKALITCWQKLQSVYMLSK